MFRPAQHILWLPILILACCVQAQHTPKELQPYDPPLAAVKINQRWGFIDTNGAVVQPPWFLEVRDYSEGLAAVRFSTGQWGYIDKRGMVTVPGRYRVAYSYNEGQALVAEGDNWYILDKRGDKIKSTLDTFVFIKRNKCPTPGYVADTDYPKRAPNDGTIVHETIPCIDIFLDPKTHKNTLVYCLTYKKAIKPSYSELWPLGKGYLGRADTIFSYIDSTLKSHTVQLPGYDHCIHIGQIAHASLLYLQKPRADSLVQIRLLSPPVNGNVQVGPELQLLPDLHPSSLRWQHNRCPVPLYRPLTGAEDSGAIVSQGPWGYIDQQGRVVIKPVFHAARGFF